MAKNPPKHTLIANKLADQTDSDIFLYNGDIARHYDRTVAELCVKQNRRNNLIFFLVTVGGDPDAAFRIARCFQEKYTKFNIVISGCCKSAGTIIATGADELAISDNGELGPLDVQMAKPDELWQNESGMNIEDALDSLKNKALQTVEDFLISLTLKSGSRIKTVTALQTATNLVVGLYGRIFEQIDPIGVGEASRAMKLAIDYGNLLNAKSHNLKEGGVEKLGTKYPHHGFVIDRKEAESLFENVRPTNDLENELINALGTSAIWQLPKKQFPDPFFCFLSDEKKAEKEASDESERKADSEGDIGKERQTVGETGERQTKGKKASTVTELPKQTRTSAS